MYNSNKINQVLYNIVFSIYSSASLVVDGKFVMHDHSKYFKIHFSALICTKLHIGYNWIVCNIICHNRA